MGIHWSVWPKSADRLQKVWVDPVLGKKPGYTALFDAGNGSYIDFRNHEIRIDAMMAKDCFGRIKLPFQWGPYTLQRFGQLEVCVSRALTEHEIAHGKYTTPPVGISRQLHTIYNMLEDERIERILARHWHQAAVDLERLGYLMWKYQNPMMSLPQHPTDFYRSQALMAGLLYWRWDHEYHKQGTLYQGRPQPFYEGIHWDPTTRARWDRCRPLIEAAWDAPDTPALMIYARQLEQIIFPGSLDQQIIDNIIEHVLEQLKRVLGKLDGERLYQDDADDADAPFQPPSTDDGVGQGTTPEEDLLTETDAHDDPSGGTLEGIPYRLRERALRGQIQKVTDILRVPSPETEVLANNRAGRYSARANARSQGRTPVVRQQEPGLAPEGLAVVLLIDGSGSMGNAREPNFTMHPTVNVALTLERACAATGIALQGGICGGSAGVDQGSRLPSIAVPSYRTKNGKPDMIPQRVRWWKTFATLQGSLAPALLCGLDGRGGFDSVAEGIREAEVILRNRPEKTKLIISMHDGDPVDYTKEYVRKIVDNVRSRGTLVVGVTLANTYYEQQIPDEHERERAIAAAVAMLADKLKVCFGDGPDDLIVMRSIDELALRLGRVLERYQKRKGW